jgi:uncharacterized protein
MGSTATFPLVTTTTATAQVTVADPTGAAAASPLDAFLGYGLLSPFRRDRKGDFANGGGMAVVSSALRQILGVRGANERVQGELPWRTEFGSQLPLLRHRNNDEILEDFARVYVVDAIERWEPRVTITNIDFSREDHPTFGPNTILRITAFYRLIEQNVSGNNVLLDEQKVDVPVLLAA